MTTTIHAPAPGDSADYAYPTTACGRQSHTGARALLAVAGDGLRGDYGPGRPRPVTCRHPGCRAVTVGRNVQTG